MTPDPGTPLADVLPEPLTSFVGRQGELAELSSLLDRHRLVTIAGAGGCGKTRLALHAARDRAPHLKHGAWSPTWVMSATRRDWPAVDHAAYEADWPRLPKPWICVGVATTRLGSGRLASTPARLLSAGPAASRHRGG